MRRLVAVGVLGLLAAVTAAPAPAASLLLSDHALLALTGDDGAALVRARGGRLVSPSLRLWRVDTKAALELAPVLRTRGVLRYAEPDLPLEPAVLPSDPLSAPEIGYHLYRIGADRAEPPPPGFPVTIIDTGLDLAHQEFAHRPNVQPLNEQIVRNPARLESYHGTIVASTAAAPVDGIGAVGVDPNVPLRVFDAGELSDASVIAGLGAAVAAGPSVINLSLGGTLDSPALKDAVLHAIASGSLVVAASGNERLNGDPPFYPASLPHVLTVGSSDAFDQVSSFSSSSPGLDLVAPGENIPYQEQTGPGYHFVTGTSFSAPAVSAAAAWVKTARPELTTTQLYDVMRLSAREIGAPGYDSRAGFGILDIPNALAYPAPPDDPQEPNDDVDQVLAHRVFRSAKAALNGSRGGPARVDARVEPGNDPHDVYRLTAPPRRQLVVTIAADDAVRGALLASTARSVTVVTPGAGLDMARAGRSVRLTFTNRTARPRTVLADVGALGETVGRAVSYRLSVSVRPAPPARR